MPANLALLPQRRVGSTASKNIGPRETYASSEHDRRTGIVRRNRLRRVNPRMRRKSNWISEKWGGTKEMLQAAKSRHYQVQTT